MKVRSSEKKGEEKRLERTELYLGALKTELLLLVDSFEIEKLTRGLLVAFLLISNFGRRIEGESERET